MNPQTFAARRKELETQAKQIIREAEQLERQVKDSETKAAIDRLTKSAEQLQFKLAVQPYADFQKSLDFVRNYCSDTAENTITRQKYAGRLADDRLSFLTFDNISPGATLEIGPSKFIVSDFKHDFGGSTATLQPAPSTATIGPAGTKSNPFNGTACHFDSHKRVLTLSKSAALKPDDVVEIGGTVYRPTSTFLKNAPGVLRYELTEATK